ncbi:MAG: magnesium transporter [Alphaproteobacteria bacterium]|nr:MAG: magnesium transporter [Alphaproteobacteria bacterium]
MLENEQSQSTTEDGIQPGDAELYGVPASLVEDVATALKAGELDAIRKTVTDLHAADQADLMEQLTSRNLRRFIDAFLEDLDPEALSELEETVRDEVIDLLEPQEIAAAVAEMDTDDAVYVIEDLDESERREILDAVPDEERFELEAGLSYPEDSAGRLMQQDFISVPTYWTVGQTIDHMREDEDLPEDFYEIFVVDAMMKPVGTIPLNRILRTKRDVDIAEIMEHEPILVPANMDQEEVAFLVQQYDLVSALVVDDSNRLIGSIMIDDIVDVIQEEAEEDIMLLGGVGDGGIHESTFQTTRDRFVWLFANLGTAILASIVISQFGGTIEQMVALAVLMPIVASMGGNAGTQTLTIAVRALGTKELTSSNALRTISREAVVGVINGILFAVIMGVVAALWFDIQMLGFVIAAAMIINMIVAALAGILIPLGLHKAGIDPAVASSVFVTTITDVVGFFAFLSLAAKYLV